MDKLPSLVATAGVALALVAGCVMALQPAVNGRLASQCQHPLQASLISFGSGFIALLIVCFALGVGIPSFPSLRSLPWWAWTGGLLGTYMVTVSLLVAPKLGATRWIALVLAGQIALSLLLDHFGFMGYTQHSFSWLRMAGVSCVALGVWIVMNN